MTDEREIEECEVIALYEFLGKKWTITLLHNLGSEPLSYNDLRHLTHHLVNPTLLSQRLKGFVAFKVVTKSTMGKNTFYTLTPRGTMLKAHLHRIKWWAIEAEYRMPAKCRQGICVCDNGFSSDDDACRHA